MITEFLKRLPLFAGLDEQSLTWLVDNAETVLVQAGELLMEEGDPADGLYVTLDGDFEIMKRSGKQDVLLAVRGAGEMIGEMSLLEGGTRGASVRAIRDCRLLKISKVTFDELLCTNPSATLAMLRTVNARLRNTEAMLGQSAKMIALGTLAAGLAHELNNPAAAARRSADQLSQTISNWLRARVVLDSLALTPQLNDIIVSRLRADVARRTPAQLELDPLARSDRESEVEAWFEQRGIDGMWEYSPILVAFDWDAKALQTWSEQFSTEQVPATMRWIAHGYTVYTLLSEVVTSAERISEIVNAVKSYSYLDQAPIQEVNVHDGLDNTLVILKHKVKQGVHVTRDYAPDLPRIEAYGSELNQVWTNLIDNAIDAMQGQGELGLRTRRHNDGVLVEISDNGPGIPPDVQARIFEPFFTTKPVGVGTGLGLHISYNIVQKHHGQIEVESSSNGTRFRVVLPVRLK